MSKEFIEMMEKNAKEVRLLWKKIETLEKDLAECDISCISSKIKRSQEALAEL